MVDFNKAMEEIGVLDGICGTKDRYVYDVLGTLGKLVERADPQGLLRVANPDGAMRLIVAPAAESGEPSNKPLVNLFAIKTDVRGAETVSVYSWTEGKTTLLANIPPGRNTFTEREKITLIGIVNEGLKNFAPGLPGSKAQLAQRPEGLPQFVPGRAG